MERDFKGVWVPKEIWLNKELNIMEKLFLVEIDSLDREQGCFASNSYFAQFFGLKNTRVSQIINSLIKKGFINARYERKGREIVKRVLTIKCKKVFNKVYEGIQNSVTTYSEKCKENNTINNTNNTINESFEKFWNLYDKKRGKPVCINLWKKIKPELYDTIYQHIQEYKKVQPDKLFRKDPERYLKYKCWNDEIINKQPERLDANEIGRRI